MTFIWINLLLVLSIIVHIVSVQDVSAQDSTHYREVKSLEDSLRLFLLSSNSGHRHYIALNIKTPYKSGRVICYNESLGNFYEDKLGGKIDAEYKTGLFPLYLYPYLAPYLLTNDTFDIRKFPKSKNRRVFNGAGVFFVKPNREVDSVAELGKDAFLSHFFYLLKDSTYRYRQYRYEQESGLSVEQKYNRRWSVISHLYTWGVMAMAMGYTGHLRYVTSDEVLRTLKEDQERRLQDKVWEESRQKK